MLIHDVISVSLVNGPGERFVIWTQGCKRNCPGCFNPETHVVSGVGQELDEQQIIALIPKNCRAITVSGGEPFDQAEGLSRLLQLAKKESYEVLVYTGYTLEELRNMSLESKKEAVAQSLELIDILIDGPYEKNLPSVHQWTGSGNQKVHFLSQRSSIEEKEVESSLLEAGEIFIEKNGNIRATGIFNGLALKS